MEILTKLTAAEAYLITANSKATFKDLLKVTLIDLLLKRVLTSEKRESRSHANDPSRSISYIKAGSNFGAYNHRPHEDIFLKPFFGSEYLQVMFRHLVQIGYENAVSKRHYVFDQILCSDLVKDCIRHGLIYRLLNSIELTSNGHATKRKIDDEVAKLEKELPTLIKSNPESAMKMLAAINGNVSLLKSFDFALLDNIDEEFASELRRRNDARSSGCSGCFVYFDSYSASFDDGFNFSDDGSSGCGGDSGCAGCSGCGGCGGCGS